MSRGPEGPIVIEACGHCGARWALPRRYCPRCGGDRINRRGTRGSGRVFASTLVHRTPDDAFRGLTPCRIALVDLDEGPRLMGHLVGEAPIGARVEGSVREVAGRPIPVFGPQEVRKSDR